jgi:hypothetical protein
MQTIEQFYPPFKSNGLFPVRVLVLQGHDTTATVSTTATLTAAQVATGYIVNTSTTATLTMPTGTLLGTLLGVKAGDTFDFFIDNTTTATTQTITLAASTNAIATTTNGTGVTLTTPAGTSGISRYTVMFSSPTAYVFGRSA